MPDFDTGPQAMTDEDMEVLKRAAAARKHRSGADLIAAERRRQIEVEGWTPEHDQQHDCEELALAGAAYALLAAGMKMTAEKVWPWGDEWWKPKRNRRSNLIRAGALIAAELDRLALLPASPATTGGDANE